MIPARYDFKFWTNSDYSETIVITADSGLPVNLTGYVINAHFRRTPADTTILFSLTTVATAVEGFKIVDNGFEMRVNAATIAAAYAAIDTNSTFGQTAAIVGDFVFLLPTGEEEVWIDSVGEINYGVTR